MGLTITPDKAKDEQFIFSTINNVLHDERFKQHAASVSSALRAHPRPGAEVAAGRSNECWHTALHSHPPLLCKCLPRLLTSDLNVPRRTCSIYDSCDTVTLLFSGGR